MLPCLPPLIRIARFDQFVDAGQIVDAEVREGVGRAAGEDDAATAGEKDDLVRALQALHVVGDHDGSTARGREVSEGIRHAAEQLDEVLPSLERAAAGMVLPFAYTGRMFVIGRGVEFATAREIALKLLETCRIAAEPLTATDLAHGPVAALDPLFPVWAIASHDATLGPVQEAASRARAMGATLVASGTAATELEGAAYALPVPVPTPQLLSPLLSVVPGQLFAWALARARGLDPDAPEGLAKVTLVR